MTGKTSRIRKYILLFKKSVLFGKIAIFKKYFGEFFFLVILKFFIAALDAQQNFMPRDIFFFFLSLFDQKL